MKNYLKYFFVVSIILITKFAFAESNDMGVCFVKVQKRTLQTLVNEIAITSAENSHIQAKMKYYNGLKSLFVFVDTYNYKLFWVTKPNKQWLDTNCFQHGYITDLDFTRRAITRVYDEPSQPIDNILKFQQQRTVAAQQPPAPTPVPPPPVTPPAPVAKQEEKNQEQPKYNTPNIIMHNYYNVPGGENKNPTQYNQPPTQQEKSSPVNIINLSNDEKKQESEKKEISLVEKNCVNFDLPDYLSEPSYFFEANPFMAHEKVTVKGSGDQNEFNMFDYGLDLKIGYRFNQYFNAYVQGRYSQIDKRSVAGVSTVDQTETYDAYYGIGFEHVASRFLSLAVEYNFLQIVSLERLTPVDLITVRDDQHTVSLVFKFNFIAHDEFRLGISENFGMSVSGSTDEVMYDSRTKLYIIKSFDGGHFGASVGYERNRFKYESSSISEANRHRYIVNLNYGFDL